MPPNSSRADLIHPAGSMQDVPLLVAIGITYLYNNDEWGSLLRGREMAAKNNMHAAWLIAEVIAGVAIIVIVGIRNDLSDYASVLPTMIVVAIIGGVARLFRRRSFFVIGTIGAIAGVLLYNQRLYVTFAPGADFGQTEIAYWKMVALEIRLPGALAGGCLGLILAAIFEFVKRKIDVG